VRPARLTTVVPLVLASCALDAIPPGTICGADGGCPSNQSCVNGRCLEGATGASGTAAGGATTGGASSGGGSTGGESTGRATAGGSSGAGTTTGAGTTGTTTGGATGGSTTGGASTAGGGSTTGGTTGSGASSGGTSGGGVAWVYEDGVFGWIDDSFCAQADYQDTDGGPEEGPYDVAVHIQCAYGGWQPYVKSTAFDVTGYRYLIFDLKPTTLTQQWSVAMGPVGDGGLGPDVVLNINYGPASTPGVWGHYVMPLSVLGVASDAGVLMFAIQDQTGLGQNLFYVDNVGFSP
jgi:hypothetical protein